MSNKELFKEAHKMAKEIKKEYPNVDYMFQFSLCLSCLREEGIEEEKITWEDVAKAAEKAVDNLGYTDYYVKNWVKGEYNRSYVELRWYHKGKCKATKQCGYWDNNKNEYVVDSKFTKNYNVFKL
ncbi:hypothetical protein [Clostridium saccharoperbutylacetonicum]|uniref:hypothetical protein n=1 Tax=Clostridium saccharoperbutylacetonicum TaxID=36745 RepID=UPI0039EA6EE9